MPANYKLSKNNFNNEEDTYRALVKHVETLSQEDILDEMEWRSSSLTKADMLAFIEDHDRAILRALLKGKRVTTELVEYKLSVKGNFIDDEDQFDPARHKIVPKVLPGPALRREVSKVVQIEKQRPVKRQPSVDKFINMYNGQANTTLSPTHTARIVGSQLRFDPADPEQGLFLVPQTNGSGLLSDPTPIQVEEISRMTSGEIIFRVPDNLASGGYKLEVRARFGQSNIRTGAYEEVLTVA
jgi:hypothetical protein